MATNKTTGQQGEPLRQVQKAVSEFLKLFEALKRIKAKASDIPAALDKAALHLPAPEAAGRAVADLRAQVERLAKTLRTEREQRFGATLSAFIREHGSRAGAHETHDGWRVGRLEIAVRKDAAQARALYNHEPLCDWRPIDSPDALVHLMQESETRLQRVELPDEILVEVFWRAYRYLRAERKQANKSRADEVPIRDFYAEVRVALVRHELRAGKASRKLTWAEFPEWAFLYNFDRYLALGAKRPAERRLRPQTGSQAEEARGMGMTVGGLNPTHDYKSYCYVVGQDQQ
jgi:hypothetical protein